MTLYTVGIVMDQCVGLNTNISSIFSGSSRYDIVTKPMKQFTGYKGKSPYGLISVRLKFGISGNL
jgi:hypothetical protein